MPTKRTKERGLVDRERREVYWTDDEPLSGDDLAEIKEILATMAKFGSFADLVSKQEKNMVTILEAAGISRYPHGLFSTQFPDGSEIPRLSEEWYAQKIHWLISVAKKAVSENDADRAARLAWDLRAWCDEALFVFDKLADTQSGKASRAGASSSGKARSQKYRKMKPQVVAAIEQNLGTGMMLWAAKDAAAEDFGIHVTTAHNWWSKHENQRK